MDTTGALRTEEAAQRRRRGSRHRAEKLKHRGLVLQDAHLRGQGTVPRGRVLGIQSEAAVVSWGLILVGL